MSTRQLHIQSIRKVIFEVSSL